MNLVLASQSPRRRELLTTAGFQFTIRVRPVEEQRAPNETPEIYVRRLAREKAEAAWEGRDNEVILGADTIVVLDKAVLEKPSDAADARRMLTLLSGRQHTVITGICLRHAHGAEVDSVTTLVHFLPLSVEEVAEYVASGEPMDKAGAYAIQGLASKFIDRIEGDFSNVVGLPVYQVYRYFKKLQNDVV